MGFYLKNAGRGDHLWPGVEVILGIDDHRPAGDPLSTFNDDACPAGPLAPLDMAPWREGGILEHYGTHTGCGYAGFATGGGADTALPPAICQPFRLRTANFQPWLAGIPGFPTESPAFRYFFVSWRLRVFVLSSFGCSHAAMDSFGRGRDVGYPTPPARIPASGITAPGSCLGY